MRETTALGAAIAAGLAVRMWKGFTELRDINSAGGSVFEPKISREESTEAFRSWEKAVKMSKGWVGKDGQGQQTSTQESENETSLPTKDGLKVSALKTAVKGRGVPPLKASFSISGDLEDADEEDLLLELRRIEVLQKLKRVRNIKGACI